MLLQRYEALPPENQGFVSSAPVPPDKAENDDDLSAIVRVRKEVIATVNTKCLQVCKTLISPSAVQRFAQGIFCPIKVVWDIEEYRQETCVNRAAQGVTCLEAAKTIICAADDIRARVLSTSLNGYHITMTEFAIMLKPTLVAALSSQQARVVPQRPQRSPGGPRDDNLKDLRLHRCHRGRRKQGRAKQAFADTRHLHRSIRPLHVDFRSQRGV